MGWVLEIWHDGWFGKRGGALWGLLVGEGGRREGVAVYCRWESLGSVAHKIFMVGWLVAEVWPEFFPTMIYKIIMISYDTPAKYIVPVPRQSAINYGERDLSFDPGIGSWGDSGVMSFLWGWLLGGMRLGGMI